MPDPKIRMESLLFNYQTTNLTDYQPAPLEPPVITKYKKTKQTCAMKRPPPLKDVHTMTEWKTEFLPFDFLHKKRPIIGTDPREIQKPYERTVDEDYDTVRKTRPRVVMTPQVPMDDIEDPEVKGFLLDDMYTSNATRVQKDAAAPAFNVKAPIPGHPAPPTPINLPVYGPQFVSPEWRMETVKWDNEQLRTFCDPTKIFWLNRDKSFCGPCKQTEIANNFRKTKCLEEARKR